MFLLLILFRSLFSLVLVLVFVNLFYYFLVLVLVLVHDNISLSDRTHPKSENGIMPTNAPLRENHGY